MILYCADNLGLEGMGGGICAVNDLQALLRCGYPVTVVSNKKVPLHAEVDGRTISEPEWIACGTVNVPSPPDASWRYLRSQYELVRLTAKIRALKPKLIVAQAAQGHRRLQIYRSWDGIPKITTVQGTPDHYRGIYHHGVDDVPRCVKEMAIYDRIVMPSERACHQWSEESGIPLSRFTCLYNHIDEMAADEILRSKKSTIRAELSIPEDCFAVVCVASVQRRKAQDIIINQFDRLAESVPGIQLYIVGPVVEHWGGGDIVRMITRQRYRDRIHLVGAVPHEVAMRYIYAGDLFVHPSREEIFGLVNAEAMYLGTPIVASDVDGIPELVQHELNGLLFSHARPEELSGMIIRIARDPLLRASFVDQGRKRYQEKFTRKKYLSDWETIVDEMIKPGV